MKDKPIENDDGSKTFIRTLSVTINKKFSIIMPTSMYFRPKGKILITMNKMESGGTWEVIE